MKKFYNSILFVLTFFISIISLSQTSTKSGNWNDATVWNTGVVPISSGNVTIANGHTVTVTDNRSCASVLFNGANATLAVNLNITLTVSGGVTLNANASSGTACTISGSGTLNCASITVGGNTITPSASATTIMTSEINTLTITGSGNLTLGCRNSSPRFNNPGFYLNSGTLTVPGQIVPSNVANFSNQSVSFYMDQGAQTGTLILTGATPWATDQDFKASSGWGNQLNGATYDLKLNGTNATVVYNANGNQTINRDRYDVGSGTVAFTYTNLTLGGSGNKSLPTNSTATVNGTLSMQGTAAMTNKSPTYGASSTLEYKGSSLQTTTSIEFPTSSGPRNLTINNSSGVTLHSARTIGGVLTLTNGVITTTSTNTLTLTSSLAGAVSGGSSTSYVNGPLDRTLAASTNYFYPVGGNTSNYRPINLNSVSVTGNPVVRVTVFETGASTVDRTTLSSLLGARNWRIEQISGTFTSANLVITESGMTNGIHHIGKSTTQSGDYVSLGNGQTVTSDQISSPSAQGVGFYAVGVSGVALPIELYEFNGVKNGKNNYIYWITSSEQNTIHFDLQKSKDGETWNTITTLNAAGNSTKTINYNATDYNVEPIINYYRLQQHDLNGVYQTYGPISINNTNPQKVVKYLNIIGQEIESIPNTSGVYIEVYSDGVTKLVWK